MKKEVAEQLIEQNRKNYNFLTEDFARTRSYPWEEMKLLLTYIKKGNSLLDIGSGSGRTFELVKDLDITFTGIDISEEMVKRCQTKYGKHAQKPTFLCQNAVSLSFDDDTFDTIFLHTICDLKRCKNFLGCLKKMGYCL